MDTSDTSNEATGESKAKPLKAIERRILGVLIEKARTTPDSYPLSLNGLVTGCNQKSNRSPLMSLTAEQVEDALIEMRERGIVAEVHGGGRVPKYRHYAHDFMGTQGIEVGVMAELLLRGEQSVGDLRSRANRFGSIPDLGALQEILKALEEKGLVIALTPPGRGQMYTHKLYEANELERIQSDVASGAISASASRPSSTPSSSAIDDLKKEIESLKEVVQKLSDRVEKLES